jgi:serine/threonine protein kinase
MIRTIATEVAQAMRFLYSNNPPITHGDLRTVNIMVDKGHAKVINFGVNGLYPRIVHNDAIGYMAPELSDSPSSEATDVYCFAMVLYALLFYKEPFEEFNALQIHNFLSKNQRPPIVRQHAPVRLLNLISTCWHQDPLCRPRFKKIERKLQDNETWNMF